MANDTLHNLDMGQLDMMWQFLMMGKQKSNIPVLKKYGRYRRDVLCADLYRGGGVGGLFIHRRREG